MSVGANGRRIVMQGLQYEIDVAALKEFANSDEALAKASDDECEARSTLSKRELIKRFLKHVDMDNCCTVSYTHSAMGQALIDAGHLTNSRLYPDRWPSCPTQLGKKLRNLALGHKYVELDDKDAFHRLLQNATTNERAKGLIDQVIEDSTLKARLATHYFGDAHDESVAKVKTLLHAMSNEGSPETWREEHEVPAQIEEHEFVLAFKVAQSEVTEELAQKNPAAVEFIRENFPTKQILVKVKGTGKKRAITVQRDPRRTWKSYFLQQGEVKGLFAKMTVAEQFGADVGPPLHDCLFVARGEQLDEIAAEMASAVSAASGADVIVRVKETRDATEPGGPEAVATRSGTSPSQSSPRGATLQCHALKHERRSETSETPRSLQSSRSTASTHETSATNSTRQNPWALHFSKDSFNEKDFLTNAGLDDDTLKASLDAYAQWLRRFFVAIVKKKTPIIAELEYIPGTDNIKEIICRSPRDTLLTYPDMSIYTSSNEKAKPIGLLTWYLKQYPDRKTADQLQMWPNPQDAKAHPKDLNIFGGLPFDKRYEQEEPLTKTPFHDPFPTAPPIFPRKTWRDVEGLNFILWHMRNILANADPGAFAYFVQWFAYVLQKRRKPSVLVMLYGAQGIGKSALVGENQNGMGLLARIYGNYYQSVNDIDYLLQSFNMDSANKLFCCMEEATPYRKAHRNNEKLKDLISGGRLRIEPKGIDAFFVNDFRAFVCCTNHADAFKIAEDDRRHFCLEANDGFSKKAVGEGRCTAEERRQYMAKLDRTKNDDEVAYEFFKYMMSLDLSGFNVDEPYATNLHNEQRSHNECAVRQFLIAAVSGEYPCRYASGADRVDARPFTFTCLQLHAHFKEFLRQSGLATTVDNVKSLGWALKRYPDLIRKLDGKPIKYAIKVTNELLEGHS